LATAPPQGCRGAPPVERLDALGRVATPADIYGAALFLALPAHATGTEVVIDGGGCLGNSG
jgi:hypothetical protein